jgi:NAD dependent epimerase/dehydratase family enzyme
LILNITNNNSRLCEDFSTPELVQALSKIILENFGSVAEELASNERKESLLDTVILALGALINLTEWSGTARRLILSSRSDETTHLDGLITLFSDGLESISEVSP